MKKIISVFQRNYHEPARLIRDEVVPGAEWVLAGEGVATRKWDGTSCFLKEGKLYKRYDVKKGKTPPPDFIPAQDPDPVTGHYPGWVPVVKGRPEDIWHREAFVNQGAEGAWLGEAEDGTYELCGPQVNKNPDGFLVHVLVPHGKHPLRNVPRTFEGMKAYLAETPIEGIVFWRKQDDPNAGMAKVKAKDFGLRWPR